MNPAGLDKTMEARVARAAAEVAREVGSLGDGPPFKALALADFPVSPVQPPRSPDRRTRL